MKASRESEGERTAWIRFGGFAMFWAGLILAVGAAALAQDADETDPPPELPETEVEGNPPELPETEVEGTPPQIPETPVEGVFSDSQPPTSNPPAFNPPSVVEGTSLDPFSPFESPPIDGYRAESATVGSLLDLPILETPATIGIISEDLIEDQQILNVQDLVRNVPGASVVPDFFFADRIFVRGLEVRTRDFRKNGFLDPTFTPRDFANIQRVEILKGPASILYGPAGPAATVNFVTKKPLPTSFAHYDYVFGSFDLGRHQVDVNTPLDCCDDLLFRFNGAYEDTASFRDFGFQERHLIAPSVRWNLSERTQLTWEGEVVKNRRRGDRGIPVLGGDPLGVPNNVYVGEPGNDFLDTEDYRTSLVLNHKFCNDWALYVGVQTVSFELPSSQTYAVANVGGTNFARLRQDSEEQDTSSSLIAALTGDVELLGVNHKLVYGTEQVYFDSESSFLLSQLPGAFDVANPVYTNPAPAVVVGGAQFPVFRQYRQGYFVQDLIEINEHWQILAGVRIDDVDFTLVRDFGFGPLSQEQRFRETSPRVGVVWQPIPEELMGYFAYTQSFNPPTGGNLGVGTDPVLPELGETFEGGVKMRLLENLSLTATGFYTTRENVPFVDFSAVPLPAFFQIGRERSQGCEVEMVGAVTDDFSLIGYYSYVDTRLTDSANPAIFGQRARNIPLHQASCWGRYNLIQTEDRTCGVALGMVFVDERTANLSGSVELPDYTRWDCGFYATSGSLDVGVYIENLFDNNYAAGSIDEFQVFPGAPINARASVGLRY